MGLPVQAGALACSLLSQKETPPLGPLSAKVKVTEGRSAWNLELDEEIFFLSVYQLRTVSHSGGLCVCDKHTAVGAKPG